MPAACRFLQKTSTLQKNLHFPPDCVLYSTSIPVSHSALDVLLRLLLMMMMMMMM
jgi:hypothetical protein